MLNLNSILVNGLLGQLKNQNPSYYQQVMNLMNSGKSPDQVLNELLASGQFTQEQINQARNIANNKQTNNGANRLRF